MKRIILIATSLAAPALAQTAPPTRVMPAPSTPQTSAQSGGPVVSYSTPAQRFRASGGSLFRAATMQGEAPANPASQVKQVSIFAVTPPEPKVLKKHDLVTIIVREESNSSSEGSTDLKKETTVNAKLSEYVQFDPKNFTLKSVTPTAAPGFDFSGKHEMKADGSVDRKDVVILRITAEVVDVKPNDTLVLSARKQIKVDDEEQYIAIAGTCRAGDVTIDNTVLSTQLSDLNVTKSHKGGVRDTNHRGWLTKLLDQVNPF
jgi:flagellar L-ring protein precursor FlgH